MPNLAKSIYNELLDDICGIYEKAQAGTRESLNQLSNTAYWDIGRAIVTQEQKHLIREKYSDKLLKNLARNLTQKLGNGFSLTNLKYMRKFYLVYPKGHTCDLLNWTQQRILLTIKDKRLRKAFEQKTIKNKWTTHDLAQILKKEKVALDEMEKPKTSDKHGTIQLSLIRGRLALYRVVEHHGLQMKNGMKSVDLGFNVYQQNVKGLSKFKHGDLVEVENKTGQAILQSSMASQDELYTYKAILECVEDGNTICVDIECGFDIWRQQRLRLRGVDTPELSTKTGKNAKEFVERTLRATELIIIKTHGTDKYGYYWADIFYAPAGKKELSGVSDPATVATKGTYLNQELLDMELARVDVARG